MVRDGLKAGTGVEGIPSALIIFIPYNKGLKMPESIRKKISLAQKGRDHTSFEAPRKAPKGKPKSEALRLAISKACKGKIGLLAENGRARVTCV